MKALITAALLFGSCAASAASTNERSALTTRGATGAPKTYCLAADYTGTRITKKVCKTEREWAAEGVEIARR